MKLSVEKRNEHVSCIFNQHMQRNITEHDMKSAGRKYFSRFAKVQTNANVQVPGEEA